MEQELYHYGVLGMKWGIRRYQNADGSLTDAGKKHYGSDKVIGDRKRIDRARDADLIDRKIGNIRVQTDDGQTHYFNKRGKEIVGKKKDKIEKLSKMREGLVKDLDPREVEYGKMLNNAAEAGAASQSATGIVSFLFGFPAGMAFGMFSALGSAAIYSLSKEGRESIKLGKELKKANKEAKKLLKEAKANESSKKWDPAAMFENAKNNGKYNIDFVEYTQNEEWSDKKALSEYKKYLKDPNGYIEKLHSR